MKELLWHLIVGCSPTPRSLHMSTSAECQLQATLVGSDRLRGRRRQAVRPRQRPPPPVFHRLSVYRPANSPRCCKMPSCDRRPAEARAVGAQCDPVLSSHREARMPWVIYKRAPFQESHELRIGPGRRIIREHSSGSAGRQMNDDQRRRRRAYRLTSALTSLFSCDPQHLP